MINNLLRMIAYEKKMADYTQLSRKWNLKNSNIE